MTQHHFRAPQYPVILALGGSVFAVGSHTEFEAVVEKELENETAIDIHVVVDSGWEGFGYYPEQDMISPLCVKKDWTKKELVDLVNLRTNRSLDARQHPSELLPRITKQRLFEALVAHLKGPGT